MLSFVQEGEHDGREGDCEMATEPEYTGPKCHVNVNAIAVKDNGNGTFTIELPARETTYDQTKVLEELFPNSFDKVEELLLAEALMASRASRADMMRPSKKQRSNY